MNVRYEDIVLNETDTMERIASFIGLKNTNYNFDSTNLCDAYGNPWYSNSSFESNDSSSSFDVQSSIQRWKSNLSQSEVKLTEMICADVMQHYEYFPSLSTATDDSVYNLLRGNEVTEGYLKNFLNTGRGIQSFPSDPLDPRNWEKN